MATIVAGVDIGGSHITVALVDLSTRTILSETLTRRSVDARGTADEIMDSWCKAIRDCFAAAERLPGKIGIAMPGPFDYENGISLMKDQDKYDALFSINIKKRLSKELGINSLDIRIKNDAVCFLQGEVFGGSAVGSKHVLCLTLGTGFGSALYRQGITTDAEKWCASYKNDIAENFFCTRWFIKRYKELSGKAVENVKQLFLHPDDKHVVEQVFTEFSYNLADFLIAEYGDQIPSLVIIGGNISNAEPYFFPLLRDIFSSRKIKTTIKRCLLGESAALMGAASAWVEDEKMQLSNV